MALKFLQTLPEVDNSRFGLFGKSFGGTIATLAGGLFQQIKSMALWAPMFNAHQWQHRWALANTQKLDEETLQKLMVIDGQLASLPFFEQFFSIDLEPSLNNLQHIPFLHIHGTADQIVDISHAHLYKKLRANALAESEFIELLDADHDFSRLEDQYHALKITTDWFKSTLK